MLLSLTVTETIFYYFIWIQPLWGLMKRKNDMFRDGTFGVGEIFTACKEWFLKEGKYQRNSLGFFARLFLEQLVITEIFYEIGYTFGVEPLFDKTYYDGFSWDRDKISFVLILCS